MLLNLKVLRGVDLLALDENYLTESSSDPYCQIFVNGHKVGWTPVRNATLDPVWGDDMSSFEIQGGGGTRVTIKIFDYDGALSDDDYMGQVTFYAQDFLDRTSDTYPNIWATIEPPEGRDYAGKLQLRIAAPADEAKKKSRLMRSLALSRKKPPLKLSAGPSLSPEIKSCLHKHLFFAKAPVILHVYDVGKDSRIHALNQVLPATGAGGIFHGAIEVHGREYSFGYAPRERPGVFACQPQSCPMHTFRESIFLGDCQLTPSQVQAILRQLKPEWMANTYNLLQKNCCTFSNEFAIELGVGPIPEWVHALAHTAVALNEVLGRQERLEERHLRTTWRQLPVEEEDHCSASLPNLVLAHVMARRLQRAFWARKAQRVARGEVPIACIGKTLVRQATVNTYQGSGLEVESIDDDDDDDDFANDQLVAESSPHSPERRQRDLHQAAKRASEANLLPPAQLLKNLKEHMTKDELRAGLRNMTQFFGLAD